MKPPAVKQRFTRTPKAGGLAMATKNVQRIKEANKIDREEQKLK